MSLIERIEAELNVTEAEADSGLSRDARGLVDRLRVLLGQHRESERFETFVVWDDVLEHVHENGEAWIVLPGCNDPTVFGAIVLEGSVHARMEGKLPPASYGEEALGRFRKEKEKQKAAALDLQEGETVFVPAGETGLSVERGQAQAKELDSWAKEVARHEAREFKRELFMRLLLQKGGNEMQYCWETAQKAWTDKPEDC